MTKRGLVDETADRQGEGVPPQLSAPPVSASVAADILGSLPDVVVVIDEMGRINFAGGAVEQVLGFDPAEWIGRTAIDIVHPDDLALVIARLDLAVAEPGVPRTGIGFRILVGEGRWLPVEANGWMHLDGPEVSGVVVSVRDITGRIALESARLVAARTQTVSSQPVATRDTRDWLTSEVLPRMMTGDKVADHLLLVVVSPDASGELRSEEVASLFDSLQHRVTGLLREDDLVARVDESRLLVACSGLTSASSGYDIAHRVHDLCSTEAQRLLPPIVLRSGLALATEGDDLAEVLEFASSTSHLVGPGATL